MFKWKIKKDKEDISVVFTTYVGSTKIEQVSGSLFLN